jgi:hypothetical protein
MTRRAAMLCSLLPSVMHAATIAAGHAQAPANQEQRPMRSEVQSHPYVGMWVTDDGQIRHELLPNGRYDEARGSRQSAYRGRYRITGNHIDYWDDTGFTADGTFVDANTLHHGGMVLRRK